MKNRDQQSQTAIAGGDFEEPTGGRDRLQRGAAGIIPYLFMGLGHFTAGLPGKGLAYALVEVLFLTRIGDIARGLTGLVTLGTQVQERRGFTIVQGDHSIFLMVNGVFWLVVTGMFFLLYWLSIVDCRESRRCRAAGLRVPGLRDSIRGLLSKRFYILLLIPIAFALLFLVIVPIVVTFMVAFTNYSSPNHLPPRNLVDWVGFKNFRDIVSLNIWNETFVRVGIWTLIWAVVGTSLNYALGLGMALMISRRGIRLRSFWRTLFILPHAMPIFVVLLTFRLLLSGVGPLNNALISAGIPPQPFLTDPLYARVTVILVNAWAGAPFFMVFLSSALANIDAGMYEAAELDGASGFQKFLHITIPVLLFQTAPVLIMNFAFSLHNFGGIYLLTNGGPPDSSLRYAGQTDILISWVYKMTLDNSQFHMAAVVSIMLFVVVAGISIVSLSRTRSFREEGMV